MELLLRHDVEKLGRRGEVVKVAGGYGRIYLLPHGLAMVVEAVEQAIIERERKSHEDKAAKEKAEFEGLAGRINTMRYVAPRRVGENNVLYGSVTSGDIAEYLASKGVEIDKRKIQLEEPIKALGEHEVKIKLHPEVVATLKLTVSKTD